VTVNMMMMRRRRGPAYARYSVPLVVLSLLVLMTVREPHAVGVSQHTLQKQSDPLKQRTCERIELRVIPPITSHLFPPSRSESSSISSVKTVLPRRHLEFSVFSRPPPLA
jgi:hypothetical protein